MKNGLLIHDMKQFYDIPDQCEQEAHNMSREELSIFVRFLLMKIENLEKELEQIKF
jgi:hypothetical protein